MVKKYIHELIFQYGTLALAAVIPFSTRMSTWCLLALALNWLVEGNLKQKLKTAYNDRLVIACGLLYLLELCGLFFTRHFRLGFYHLQTEASLLVIPLLYMSRSVLSRRFVSSVLYIFCTSVFLTSVFCLSIGCIRYFHSGDIGFLFYHTLVAPVHQHAVYFSVYTFICIVFLFHQLKQDVTKKFSRMLPVLVYFFGLMFLLRSKMLVGVALLYGIIQLIKVVRNDKTRTRRAVIFPVILVAGVMLILKTSNPFSRQVHELKGNNLAVLSGQKFTPDVYFNEVELRLLLWKFAVEILNEHRAWLWGISSGDAHDRINQKIMAYHMYTGVPGTDDKGYLDYNLHDQYLETLFRLGLAGLFALLWLLTIVIRTAVRARHEILFFTVVAFIFFFITESVFERQIGIVPFFFFTSLWMAALEKDPLQHKKNRAGKGKPKLFVDAHCFDKGHEGVCTFIRGLYSDPFLSEKFVIYLGACDIDNLKKAFPAISSLHFIPYRSRHPFIRLGIEIPYILYKYRFDYAHFQYITPLIRRCKYIVTTHDILFKDFKKDFPLSYRLARSAAFKYSFKNADIKTTPSEYSRERLSFHYSVPAEEINLIPNGVAHDLPPSGYNKEAAMGYIMEKFDVCNFILYVSRIEPRKNHALLLKTYIDMELYKKDISLVFVGKVSVKDAAFSKAWDEIPACIKKYIKHIHRVSQHDLVRFYLATRLFVYPSKAEGFGIPPLEATALRTPVLCADSTAMSAYTFFGENLFDPADEAGFRQKLESMLFSGSFKTTPDDLAEIVRKSYSWGNSARRLWQCLE